MAVTEVLRAVGSWEIGLSPDVPQQVWDAIQYYGHVAIHSGPVDPRVGGDSLLASARYVGVVRDKKHDDDFTVGGGGMALWLGDEDGKGWVIEDPLAIASETLEDATRLILPPAGSAILEGSYFALPGNPLFSNTFQWVTQREALNYLSDTLGADWKVLGTGHLHIGPEGSLFVTTPKTLVMRRGEGADLTMRSFPGDLSTEQNIRDFTTRVVLLASDDNGSIATADADISPGLNGYKDVHGAALHMTRLIGESSTDFTNAPARAQLQLNRFSGTSDALTLSTADYDVKGSVQVGDYIWVYDPEHKLVDNAVEIIFRGNRLNPLKLRLTETTWPVVEGMHVAYRDGDGAWTDLTPYVQWENGSTTLVVGGFSRRLGDGADGGGGLTPRPNPVPNTSVPDAPTWVEPFLQGVYQSPANGATKAQTQLAWNQPANLDSTAITDGDYYEIRYRTSTTPLFPVTHAQMAVFTHAQLTSNGGTWGQPIQYPVTDWQYARVPFTELSVILYELTPTMPYEAQIRVVDNGTPANAGDWSVLAEWQAAQDTLGPATPAAPEVSASLIGVQVVHRLGRASGGTFNLDLDLHHFEVHGLFTEEEPLTDSTRLGRMLANAGMITGEIPVVAKFQVNDLVPLYFKVVAVDEAGNASSPSPAAVATAQLIDNAHISDLTVSKITAGTMTASWIMAGEFVTGPTDPRCGFNSMGFYAHDAAGDATFAVDSATGDFFARGELESGAAGKRIRINPSSSGTFLPEIRFYPASSSDYAYINAVGSGSSAILGLNSGPDTTPNRQTTILLLPGEAQIAYMSIGDVVHRGGSFRVGPAYVYGEVRNSSSVPNGGFLRLESGLGRFGIYNPGLGTGEYWMSVDYTTGNLAFKGKMDRAVPHGGEAAFWADFFDWNGGSVGFSYGATMSGNICVVGSFDDFSSTYLGTAVWNIWNSTNTGFTMGNNTAARNGRWAAWAFRQ